MHTRMLSRQSFIRPARHTLLDSFLNAAIKPAVLLSWLAECDGSSSSFWMPLASALPSSTPHWSYELMFQMAPSVKVRCS